MTTALADKFHWDLNAKILIFAAVFLPITVAAGFWQIDRADEKQQMLDEQSYRMNMPAVGLREIDFQEQQNYRRVAVQGAWAEPLFLLENQVRNGRPGYEVIGLFESGGQRMMVNRGWVPADADRQVLPQIDQPKGISLLQGYLYRSADKPFTLGDPVWTGNWPERIQAIEWEKLEERLEAPVLPYILRLSDESDDALTTGWVIVNQTPAKHIGYAVQWFAMALALIVLTVFANSNLLDWIKNRNKKTK